MNKKKVQAIEFEDVDILFKNFSGNPTKFNTVGGKITFSVKLTQKQADELVKQGWNVKVCQPHDDYDEPLYHLPVEAKFGAYPPIVWKVTGNRKTQLDEDTVFSLDRVRIESADLVVTPYPWEMGDKHGIKAYLKTMYAVCSDADRFAAKYDFDGHNQGECDGNCPECAGCGSEEVPF